MRIEKGQMIAGFPAKLIRDMLHDVQDIIGEGFIQHWLGLEGEAAFKVLRQLEKDGYLSPHEEFENIYELTDLGTRLAMASAAAPIPRKKAEELLAGVLERAARINNDPSYTWGVKRIIVFGSYLDPSKDKLGDVDIALELDRKPGLTNDDDAAQTRKDEKEGKRFQNMLTQLTWQRSKVIKTLKAGKPGVSLHDANVDRRILEKGPTKVYDFTR